MALLFVSCTEIEKANEEVKRLHRLVLGWMAIRPNRETVQGKREVEDGKREDRSARRVTYCCISLFISSHRLCVCVWDPFLNLCRAWYDCLDPKRNLSTSYRCNTLPSFLSFFPSTPFCILKFVFVFRCMRTLSWWRHQNKCRYMPACFPLFFCLMDFYLIFNLIGERRARTRSGKSQVTWKGLRPSRVRFFDGPLCSYQGMQWM